MELSEHRELMYQDTIKDLKSTVAKLTAENLILEEIRKKQHRELCDAGGIISQLENERTSLLKRL